ncbi:MAG: caspase family protein [Nitrospiraceae bacterium]|nr:MAG: caspase family protein [Nitrospiraceae bacterium]
MSKVKAAVCFISCILFLVSCNSSRQVLKKPPSGVRGIVLSKGIDTRDTEGVPVNPTTSFSTNDREVIALFKIENLSGKHKVRWDWHDPQGNVYFSTGEHPVKTGEGKYIPQATLWHRLSIKDNKAAYLPGQWEVKVYMDNILIESKNFTLENAVVNVDRINSAALKPYPKDWGLIIGIENYDNLPVVNYARKDAQIMKEYLMKLLGVPEDNIIMLIDRGATKARIEGYLKQYLPRNVEKGTTLYVYYAGHGMPDIEKNEPYLVPYDGDTRFINHTGYRLKDFYQDLESLDIGKSYVFLDSCFSGAASRTEKMLVAGARPALIHVKDSNTNSRKVVALTASQMNQISNAYPDAKHGLFTYYLLRALRGEADENDDQWVSIKEAYTYIKKHVVRVSRRMGTEQTPVIMPSLDTLKDTGISRSAIYNYRNN